MLQDENKNEKPIYKSLLTTEEEIYEMTYDKSEKRTYFTKCDKSGKLECLLDEVKVNGQIYKPYSPNNDLVSKGVILFPCLPAPYESEEELLADIKNFIHKYLDVSPFYETIATHYVLFTWLYDRFNEVPYLRALGDYGSGKSRFLQTIGSLCYKPMFMGGSTTASPIFRIINGFRGTLILDEADFKQSDMTSEITKILNSGYQKGIPVLRSEGKGTFEVKAYDVYCPKIVATREKFSDKALESRFLIEEMGLNLRKDIPRTLTDDFHNEALFIRNKLLMWRLKNYFKPIRLEAEVLEGIHPRLGQILIPILSITDNEDFKAELKKFMVTYNSELIEDRGLTYESDIVLSILKLEERHLAKKILVKQIADEFNLMCEFEERLTPKKIGWYLRSKLQLKPYKTRDGFVLDLEKDKKRLDMWKERFGISDEDIGTMNFVNVENITGTNKF